LVYAHVGALDRVLEYPERAVEIGFLEVTAIYPLWLPEYAGLRKSERFKKFARDAGFVEYWRARGWPDLCRPTTCDQFECD